MSSAKSPDIRQPRLNGLFDDLNATLKDFIRRHQVTYDEFNRAIAFLIEAGHKGEIPLLFDVFLEATVDVVNSGGRGGTDTCVEGPFYLANAPAMKSPCMVPHRPNEPGDPLFFSGAVRSTEGAALGGSILDFWQSDAEGRYSHFNIPEAEAPFNLRARVATNDHGRFEIRTWVPAPYEIPKHGPTGALIKALGGHPWRPAHLHIRVTHPGFATLTTQLFVAGDPWIDSDVVGAVKPSLIMDFKKHDGAAEMRARGLDRPFFTLEYDFVLPHVMAKAA